MDHTPDLSECSNPACGGSCPRAGVGRRTFLSISAASVGMLAAPGMLQTAQAITRMPALTPERIAQLTERGTPTEYSGAALAKIGMPVGGGCAGQVYLSGDLYDTRPIGYCPVNRTSSKPFASTVRVLPPARSTKPCRNRVAPSASADSGTA